MTELTNNMTTNAIEPQLLRIVQRFNAVTGCEYTVATFRHDLDRLEPTVSAFKAGWDESESEARRLLADIIATREPFRAANVYLNKTT